MKAPCARVRPALVVASILALAWTLCARIAGPSDLWDQTQPKTVSYTTDIIANGRWWLPVERGELPATKPPLYNWIAAPAVRLLGFASEPGHKFPSVLALMLSWLTLVRWGRGLGRRTAVGESLGWMAGLAFVANYTIFKLGYLARPDMLLALWLLVGWISCTALFASARGSQAPRRGLALAFWISVGLAALTKGPTAVLLVAYAVPAARVVGGRWSVLGRLGWAWGPLLAAGIFFAWVVAAWRIDPIHVRNELWFHEIYGRVTGTGREGSHEGPLSIIRDLPVVPAYWIVRFLPWSLFAVLAIGSIWSASDAGQARAARDAEASGRLSAVLRGAALFVVVTIVLFSLSAGKRADYVAPAFAPGALLAAWWLLAAPTFARMPWLGPACAALTLAGLSVRNQVQPESPAPGFGDAILAFAREAGAVIRADPHPVIFHGAGSTHLQAVLGYSEMDGADALLLQLDRGETTWVVAGGYPTGPHAFATWAPPRFPGWRITPVVRSEVLPEERGWLIQVTLFRIGPRDNS